MRLWRQADVLESGTYDRHPLALAGVLPDDARRVHARSLLLSGDAQVRSGAAVSLHTPNVADDSNDWLAAIAAAVLTGAAAGVGTLLSEGLPVWAKATVTALATAGGLAAGRLATHDSRRFGNAWIAGVLFAAACALYVTAKPVECAPAGVTCFVGGCDTFSVYAQNRYDPPGAAVRVEPLRTGLQMGGYLPNQLIPVDGWVRTRAAYPSNPPPFDSDVWFHLADDKGWVSFAGVRADPTDRAPTNFDDDGGRAAPTPPECGGTIR